MQISRLELKNWRNFREAQADDLADVNYLLGPNASGKSNFLDALRFLRDVAKSKGGGLQAAIEDRGGIQKIRCLHARKDTEVRIEFDVVDEDGNLFWTYKLGFNVPARGAKEPVITCETVTNYEDKKSIKVLNRPTPNEDTDPFLKRETHLEQISANARFRGLANFLGGITYVHLVPQLLKFGDQIAGRTLEEDPFGQEFMFRISRTQARTRDARLARIESALQSIVPHLEDLRFLKDEITGAPHLEIRFRHHRPHGARQREDQFSDGTLRLISLLWLLQEGGDSPLLLEEPELSLNEEIVSLLPEVIQKIRRKTRVRRQVFITTHSESLLSNPGIDPRGVLVIEPSSEGSHLRKVSGEEQAAIDVGFSAAQVVLPKAQRIAGNRQLVLDI